MPESAVRTFTDPDAYFAGIRNLPIDGLVTGRGKFRAETTLIDLHRLQMGRFDEDLPRIIRVTPSGSRSLILFQTDPSRPAMLANAIDTSQDQIAVFGLDWPYYLRSSAGSGWGTMSLMPEDLAAAGTAIIGRELAPPSFMLPIRPPCRLAETNSKMLSHPEVARAVEQDLILALVTCLTTARHRTDGFAGCHHASIMLKFEEILAEHLSHPLSMSELCERVEVSERTLRSCCAESLGMSPIRYVLLRRLREVHGALRAGDPDTVNVAEVAHRFGFAQPGRFAGTYRAIFGETPSTTLQRTPGMRFTAF